MLLRAYPSRLIPREERATGRAATRDTFDHAAEGCGGGVEVEGCDLGLDEVDEERVHLDRRRPDP